MEWNLLFHVYCILLILIVLGLLTYVEKGEHIFYRFVLLLICMDIENNPGSNENKNNTVNTLYFFHLIARSMRNKLNYIHDIADTFHILCITETHLDNCITIRPVHLAEKDPKPPNHSLSNVINSFRIRKVSYFIEKKSS